jgi:adenylate cyclase
MAEERLQRRLAAILSADVVGYSRLVGIDEARTLSRLSALRRDLIDPTIATHSGRIVKLMGDGALVEFASAVDAVTCAIEIQRQLRERDDGGETEPIRFRIGINVGDIIIEGDDILGDGVNIAARIEGIAEPGGISISEDTWRQVQGKVAANFVDSGDQSLKNIKKRVRIYRLDLNPKATSASEWTRPTLALPDKPSIAVLAFTNMSGDPDQEYFSDGICEDIITDLSKLSELYVIARNSSFTYKGKPVDVKQVGRELGVRYVLEGSVRKAGNRVRVTGQLIDAVNGTHIWADRFDRDLTDIFAVQDELTREIISALKIKLSESKKALIAGGGTKNVDAHDFFLKGRELLIGNKRDREMFVEANVYLRRAIDLDPNYAGPYAALGWAYIFDYQNRWSDSPETALDQAEHLVDEAIAKDDQDPFVHYVAALLGLWKKDYERWAHEADRALSLNPNYGLAHLARGLVHVYTGEPAKGIPFIERAIRLDPAQQQYRHFLGTAYLVAGNYETAAAILKERIATTPTTDLSRALLASALGHLGRLDEARQIWRELQGINPRYSYVDHFGRLPFRDSADADKFTEGLRKAGLPAPTR